MRKFLILLPALLFAASIGGAAVDYPVTIDKAVELSSTPVTTSTTVYSVDDALGTADVFAGATRRAGGQGMIRHLRVLAAQSTTIGFDVMLFSRTFAGTALNEPWLPATGDVNNSFLGKISISGTAWTALGANAAYAEFRDIDLPYDLPAGVDDLSYQLVIRGGDDSVAADNIVLKLDAVWLD